jgi:[ribosomal protein S5]-alanine N-acetyltransferase
MMKVIETVGLLLRPLEPSDADDLFRMYSVPENIRFIGKGSASVDELRVSIEQHIQEQWPHGLGLFAAILKENGVMIGRAGLFRSEIDGKLEVELAYLVDITYWGRGYATEAAFAIVDHGMHTLGLERLIAIIHPENLGSIRVAEKTGFKFEGLLANYKELGTVKRYALLDSRVT